MPTFVSHQGAWEVLVERRISLLLKIWLMGGYGNLGSISFGRILLRVWGFRVLVIEIQSFFFKKKKSLLAWRCRACGLPPTEHPSK